MAVIETERLLLREFVPDDTDALAAVISDPETMRFYPEPRDRAGVESWIERNRQRYRDCGHGLWAMVLKSSGQVVGDCGLARQTVDGVDEIEIGYHLRRDLWGQGLAPEAAGACRDYGFERLGEGGVKSLEGSDVARLAALRVRDSQDLRASPPWDLRPWLYSCAALWVRRGQLPGSLAARPGLPASACFHPAPLPGCMRRFCRPVSSFWFSVPSSD